MSAWDFRGPMKRLVLPLLVGGIGSAIFLASAFHASRHFESKPTVRSFVDRNGEWIGSASATAGGLQIWKPLSQIPTSVIDETLLAEDRYFFSHFGINPPSLAKAALENLTDGGKRGGSTITQQLAKQFIQEKSQKRRPNTLTAKLQEALVAYGLEMRHSKEWILERYLNSIYYGRRCYGISAAALNFFGKDLDRLTAEEIRFLTRLPRRPAAAPEAQSAFQRPLTGRHYFEYITRFSKKGPIVETTLNRRLQETLEEALPRIVAGRLQDDPKLNLAAVVIDVKTGDLLAMVGSRDYTNDIIDGQVNAAIAERQPGSALKPFTYFLALARGFSPESPVPDEPLSFFDTDAPETEAYIPQNFDRRFRGDVSLAEALANSYNVGAVATLNALGLSDYHELLRRFGFTSLNRPPLHYGLAVTLGAGEVSLLELTNAYAALARGGKFLPVRFFKNQPVPKPEEVLTDASNAAAEITAILSDSDLRLKTFGANENMQIEDRRVAVKTGTSYENRDNWTVGYTSNLAVGVWVGHSDGTPLDTTGATGAAPVWHAAVEQLVRKETKTATVVSRRSEKAAAIKPVSEKKPWKIISPLANARYRLREYLPPENQSLLAMAQFDKEKQNQKITWYLNGSVLQTTDAAHPKFWIQPQTGSHVLEAHSEDGTMERVPFRVME